jgi:hypothetical protein
MQCHLLCEYLCAGRYCSPHTGFILLRTPDLSLTQKWTVSQKEIPSLSLQLACYEMSPIEVPTSTKLKKVLVLEMEVTIRFSVEGF